MLTIEDVRKIPLFSDADSVSPLRGHGGQWRPCQPLPIVKALAAMVTPNNVPE
jgi:hypothetical protein